MILLPSSLRGGFNSFYLHSLSASREKSRTPERGARLRRLSSTLGANGMHRKARKEQIGSSIGKEHDNPLCELFLVRYNLHDSETFPKSYGTGDRAVLPVGGKTLLRRTLHALK